MADTLGIKRARYSHYESGRAKSVPDFVWESLRKYGVTEEANVGVAAGELEVPVVSIGQVGAAARADWVDPFECEQMLFVPGHMAEGKGRFAAEITGDSMIPLVMPGDLCVFQRSDVPKIGAVVLFRAFDNRICVKKLKHDGAQYILESLNPTYDPEPAEGSMVGYLVGIYRKIGKRIISDYDPDGIRP